MKPRCSGSTLVHICEEKMNNCIDLFMSLILFWLICIANKEEEKRTAGENEENDFLFFLGYLVWIISPFVPWILIKSFAVAKRKADQEERCCGVALVQAIRHSQGKPLPSFFPFHLFSSFLCSWKEPKGHRWRRRMWSQPWPIMARVMRDRIMQFFLVMWNRIIMWLRTLDHSLPFALYWKKKNGLMESFKDMLFMVLHSRRRMSLTWAILWCSENNRKRKRMQDLKCDHSCVWETRTRRVSLWMHIPCVLSPAFELITWATILLSRGLHC